MQTPLPSVSVIVCAYTEDRWDDLLAAVDSLHHQELAPHEIIVVIDHNPRLYQRAVRALSTATVVENSEQRGLSGARNSGLAHAHGSVIAFMDEDAVAAPDWLLRLHAHYADKAVIGVGGAIIALWEEGRPDWFPPEFDWVVGCSYRGMPEAAAAVRNLIGCNMSFRREVFAAVGGFRDGIGRVGSRPVGCEETELCIRLQQHWPEAILCYDPQARVGHRVPVQRARWSYFRARCYAEGLSKALVAQLVGAGDGLASERTYTLRTLPHGVLRGLVALGSGDLSGIARASAIVGGFVTTVAGYLVGRIVGQRQTARPRFQSQSEQVQV